MPAPTITPLPDAPIRSEAPSTFTAKAEAWVAALGGFTTDVNAFAAYLDSIGTDPTSAAEIARDAVAAALVAGPGVSITVDDAGDTITIATTSTVEIMVTDPAGSALTTGDGKAYFRVPSTLNGKSLTAVAAAVITASSSGAVSAQINNSTTAHDLLSTEITIDQGETDTLTAATPAVIDGTYAAVSTGDLLRIDIDGAGTGAKGLIVEMQFQ